MVDVEHYVMAQRTLLYDGTNGAAFLELPWIASAEITSDDGETLVIVIGGEEYGATMIIPVGHRIVIGPHEFFPTGDYITPAEFAEKWFPVPGA